MTNRISLLAASSALLGALALSVACNDAADGADAGGGGGAGGDGSGGTSQVDDDGGLGGDPALHPNPELEENECPAYPDGINYVEIFGSCSEEDVVGTGFACGETQLRTGFNLNIPEAPGDRLLVVVLPVDYDPETSPVGSTAPLESLALPEGVSGGEAFDGIDEVGAIHFEVDFHAELFETVEPEFAKGHVGILDAETREILVVRRLLGNFGNHCLK